MLLPLFLACAGGAESPRYLEEWELIVLPAELSWLDLRFAQTNLGWLRGSGELRGEMAQRDTPLLKLGLDARPEQVERLGEGIRVSSDRLEGKEGRWELQILEGEDTDTRDLRAVMTRGARGPRVEQEGWSAEVLEVGGELHGGFSAAGQERLLDGRGVVIHRWGDNPPLLRGVGRQMVVVLADGLSIGCEQTGGMLLAWAFLEGVSLPVEDVALRTLPGGARELDFRPGLDLRVEIRPVKPAHVGPELEGFAPGEAQLVRLAIGEGVRGFSRGVATVLLAGETRTAHAALGWVEY